MRSILIACLLASSAAHANPIAIDDGTTRTITTTTLAIESPPPPADPVTPRMQSLGFRFGLANTQIRDHDRALVTFGTQWEIEIIERRMRAVVDYEWLMMMGEDAAMKSTRGHGHALRAGARVTVVHMIVEKLGRLYIDAESTVGASYLTDSELGVTVLPTVGAGARIGYELFAKHPEESPATLFDAHLLIGALITRRDVGLVFSIGMEWGK